MSLDSSDVEARAKTLYNKLPGMLTFTNTRVMWVKDGHSKPTVNVAHSKLTNMFCSKPGVPKKRLRLHVADQAEPYQFNFTSAPAIAENELETFKRLLSAVVTQNTTGTPANLSRAQSTAPNSPAPSKPTLLPSPASPSPHSRSGSTAPHKPRQYGFEVYQRVLTKSTELADLHRELVVSGQITEAEFWEGREHLIQAEVSAATQKKGRSSEIVVPRLKTGEQGQIMLTLTPQLLADIFEEFPVVLKAYSDNVPKPLSEAEFWERYFSSKLFDRHRASSRNSVAKDDVIFDKYLEREDDEIEPLHERTQRVQLLLDLEATEVDHGETGNERDVTMKAGKRKNAIPIIRRFNEHSERLLQSTLGQSSTSSHLPLDEPQAFVPKSTDYYSQIDLDDLHAADRSDGIALNLQNTQRFLEGIGSDASGKREEGLSTAVYEDLGSTSAMSAFVDGWSARLEQFSLEPRTADAALRDMSAIVSSRIESKIRKDDIPPYILQQLTTCATATNEFLRQFWIALYPPPPLLEGHTLAVATPAQREVKMLKMIDYLRRTNEKVDAIILTAQHAGVDPPIMRAAFAPLLGAVSKALETFEVRKNSGKT